MWDTTWFVLRRKKALFHFLLCLHSICEIWPKWLQRSMNNHGTLTFYVNIMLYCDLPVDVRNTSAFLGAWLLRRGRCLAFTFTGTGRAPPRVVALAGLRCLWSAQLELTAHLWGMSTVCCAWYMGSVPQNLQLQGLRIRQTITEFLCPFLRISYVSGCNKTVKS